SDAQNDDSQLTSVGVIGWERLVELELHLRGIAAEESGRNVAFENVVAGFRVRLRRKAGAIDRRGKSDPAQTFDDRLRHGQSKIEGSAFLCGSGRRPQFDGKLAGCPSPGVVLYAIEAAN